ncbi:MAG: S9 family peptidase [Phenylobacterium sp.]|nr:S9 family peptidase [Phenylobacterium sp.]
MKTLISVVLFSLAMGLGGSAWAAPLAAYGMLPSIEDVSISPNGKQIALMVTNGEDRLLIIQDADTQQVTLRAASGKAKVRGIRWAGDTHVLIVTTVAAKAEDLIGGRRDWMLAFRLDVASRKVTPLMDNIDEGMNTILGMPVVRTHDGEPKVFVNGIRFVNNMGRMGLYRVGLNSRKSEPIEVGANDTVDFVVGSDGLPVAQEHYDGRTGKWAIRIKSGGRWTEAVSATALQDPPTMLGLSRDGGGVLYETRDEPGRPVWKEIRFDGGSGSAPIPVADYQAAIYDPQDGRLIGHAALTGDESRFSYFDPADDRAWRSVRAAFPGAQLALVSWSNDRSRVVVRVDTPEEGPAYAMVDLATKKASWLGVEYGEVQPKDIGPKVPVQFKAADGLELSGYLTTPNGRAAKNLPLIVFPHGGPASRDTPGFDWWAQAMASRGYAVLQVNFRGSDGFGDTFLEAGYGQWGRKMQTDLSDGVRHLAGQGVIDPARVCIVGASYGGYAALAGAAIDTGVYRCAAAFAGVSDLDRMLIWSKNRRGAAAFRYWTRFMGADEDQPRSLQDISPAALADRVSIPILLIHGRDDFVVPLEQSRVMADALQKAGKPVEFIVQNGEDHYLSRGQTRLETLTSVMAFVEKHNPPN